MQHVSLLCLANTIATSVTLPLEMIQMADNIARTLNRQHHSISIDWLSVNQTLSPITINPFTQITPTATLDDVTETDLIIIPALWRHPYAVLQKNQHLVPWLIKHHAQGSTLCAVGSGSVFLAQSGLLTNRPITTHWYYFESMEQKYPSMRWKKNRLITQSGRLYCAGSVNSIADLIVHLIDKHMNPIIAKRVEQHFSPEIRHTIASQLDHQESHSDEIIALAQAAIKKRIDQSIDLTNLANQYQLSLRQFQRRFKQATDLTPLQYIQYLRCKNTKDLLKHSNLNMQEISTLVGFQNPSYLAKLFKKHTGQSPLQYRQTVRGKLFHAH